jgi:hypothetical protein
MAPLHRAALLWRSCRAGRSSQSSFPRLPAGVDELPLERQPVGVLDAAQPVADDLAHGAVLTSRQRRCCALLEGMASLLDELVKLLSLEKLEENLFRGQSQDLGWGTVFGGQVLGQALSAAVQTVPTERWVHSLHAYFLRPGDVSRPIVYEVDRIRDGGSFTTRRVVAIQHGEAIFNLAASFQAPEPGFEHQAPMPEAPPPESTITSLANVCQAQLGGLGKPVAWARSGP